MSDDGYSTMAYHRNQVFYRRIFIHQLVNFVFIQMQLLENGTVIATKTGEDIGTNTTLTLKSMSSITVGTTYNYELRVWLNETGVSQNSLMNKKFSGRIEVSSALKK